MEEARYAVLIASSQFPDEPGLRALSAPENDVDGLAAVLRSPERGGFSEVVVLKNRPQYEAVRQIQRTLNQATKDDLVVLYYSGHGKLNRSGHLYLTSRDTVLSELESSAIAVTSLRNFVDASRAQRVVIILDSCFSGAVGEVFSKGSVDDQLQLASAQGRGTYIITASTGIQTAQEKEADRHSVFTKHLIAGIDSGEADLDRDGRITADELYDYVHQHVRMESHQEPTRWGLDVRGHLVLAKSGREPRRERAEELRPLLFRLAGENRINDELLTEALEIIRLPLANLDHVQRQRDALLDELRVEKLNALELVLRWVDLSGNKSESAGPTGGTAIREPAVAAGEQEVPLETPRSVVVNRRVGVEPRGKTELEPVELKPNLIEPAQTRKEEPAPELKRDSTSRIAQEGQPIVTRIVPPSALVAFVLGMSLFAINIVTREIGLYQGAHFVGWAVVGLASAIAIMRIREHVSWPAVLLTTLGWGIGGVFWSPYYYGDVLTGMTDYSRMTDYYGDVVSFTAAFTIPTGGLVITAILFLFAKELPFRVLAIVLGTWVLGGPACILIFDVFRGLGDSVGYIVAGIVTGGICGGITLWRIAAAREP